MLASEHVPFYQDNGYLLVEQVFTPEEVAEGVE